MHCGHDGQWAQLASLAVPVVLRTRRPSCFADDLKISLIIKALKDARTLQAAIDTLKLWCTRNGADLNDGKCYVISFTRSNDYIDGGYEINGTTLKRVNTIRDLGVILDSKLTFKPQIEKVVASGKSILGFIKRRAREFQDPYLTKQLFNTLVLPVVEHVSPIWAPYREVDKKTN